MIVFMVMLKSAESKAQTGYLSGLVVANGQPVSGVSITIKGSGKGAVTDSACFFSFAEIAAGTYTLAASALGFEPKEKRVTIIANDTTIIEFNLKEEIKTLGAVVVSGSLKEVSRLEIPVPV